MVPNADSLHPSSRVDKPGLYLMMVVAFFNAFSGRLSAYVYADYRTIRAS